MLEKYLDDQWRTNPPQVTSFLTYPRKEPLDEQSTTVYASPTCGFGWRFQVVERFKYQVSDVNPRAQELVGQVELTFEPKICSSMQLRDIAIQVKVSYPESGGDLLHEKSFSGISLKPPGYKLGSYLEPPRHNGPTHFEITITFDIADGLAFPTTASVHTKKALCHSLDGPSFADTKFYLFSARVQGQPGIPKAVFTKSSLLVDSSTYMHDLLSPETGFANGTACNLQEDAHEEIAKLNADAYEYDSDSDLEDSEDGASIGKGKGKVPAPVEPVNGLKVEGSIDKAGTYPTHQAGRAIAINGTAYKTWKAFVNYMYTSDIRFNALKSKKGPTKSNLTYSEFESVRCSPKSMYRFADYAGLPQLKSIAKEGISGSLSQSNIIAELFSTFTAKYQEVIELEVDFLVDNFTPRVSKDLDDMLQLIVLGTKPHCFQVLAFAMKRLRGDRTEDAWDMLNNEPPQFSPSPRFLGSPAPSITPIGSPVPLPKGRTPYHSEPKAESRHRATTADVWECEEKQREEKERIREERLEKERLEKECLEKECLEKERLEKEREEKECLEKERLEKEREEKEREFEAMFEAVKPEKKEREPIWEPTGFKEKEWEEGPKVGWSWPGVKEPEKVPEGTVLAQGKRGMKKVPRAGGSSIPLKYP